MNNIKEDKNKMIHLCMTHKNKDLCKEELDLYHLWKEEIKINQDHHFVKRNINYVKN